MKLAKTDRESLAKEIQFVVEKMKAEPDPSAKMYFFSAIYGEARRILNRQWNSELALLHLVVQTTTMTINARLAALEARRDRGIRLPGDFMDKLIEGAENLMDPVLSEDSGKLLESLSKFAELDFATTGNGNYLYQKGILKI